MDLDKFKELGLSEVLLKEIKKKGFEEPTEIQVKTIPILLNSTSDIIGQAQTGTGKTAAFGLPLLEKLDEKKTAVQSLILTPTRELAVQIAEELNSFKGNKKCRILPIYGGQSYTDQLRRLKKGVEIVVGTPGRVFDHIRRKSLVLSHVNFVILDEADEMLNMGFIEDVEEILKQTCSERRTLMFSATMPEKIKKIAKKHMRDVQYITTKNAKHTIDLTDKIYFETKVSDKFESLCRIIDIETEFFGLVFCRTKVLVDEITNKLLDRGYAAESLHGDLSQAMRERVLGKFKKRVTRILVATDVAARGIDIDDLTHVINYSLPQDPESYVHRIGRTGRAGKKGIAITFISPSEYRKLMYISKSAKTSIEKRRLPGASEVVQIKKAKISAELSSIISSDSQCKFTHLATDLLEKFSPVDIVAAMLKYSLEDELDESKYREIEDIAEVDEKGTSRLFVSYGKKDNLNRKKLKTLISKESGIKPDKIKEVKVMDNFSFVTVPFIDAKKILKIFRKGRRGRPLIKIAENKNQANRKKSSKKQKQRHPAYAF